jgi:osmotically-inducible protein OsmY
MNAWIAPESRYYYEWYGVNATDPDLRSDLDIKQEILDRIRASMVEDQLDIDVDVKKHVVILTGTARSTLAKRMAGDDAWDTAGVIDVSNQIAIAA